MSANQCGNCQWWIIDGRMHTDADGNRRVAGFISAECRVHAPVHGPHLSGDGYPGRERQWPRTSASEGCGDFAPYGGKLMEIW